jgi:hypothetical protein
MAFVQAAMLGLQVLSTVGAARGTAKASRSQLGENRAAIGDINTALGHVESTALARGEVAEEEATTAFEQNAMQTSNMFNDLQRTTEDAAGKQDFVFSGEVQENFNRMEKRMQDEFGVTKENIDMNLEKTISSIEEWKVGETERLKHEKRKLSYANDRLRNTSTMFGALGFG